MDLQLRHLKILVYVLCTPSLATPAETDALLGHVVRFEGNWIDKKCNCRVDQGHAIWRSSIIVRDGAVRSNAHLTIRLATTGQLEAFDCSNLDDCADPLDIVARTPKDESSNRIGIFLRAALGVLREDPGTGGNGVSISGYARTLSGRGTDIQISDAIVPLRNGRPDISAVFANAKAGTYLVDFCPIGKTGGYVCPKDPETEEFRWHLDASAAVSSRELRPSLYELFLCRRQGDRVFRRRESAFVLVAASEAQAVHLTVSVRGNHLFRE